MKIYLIVATVTFILMLIELLHAVKIGAIKLSGMSTKADWLTVGIPLFHGVVGAAAIWPLTLPLKVWVYYKVFRTGEGPTMSIRKEEFWPDDQERWRQMMRACEALNQVAPAAVEGTREVVVADALLYSAWVQHYCELHENRGWSLSDARAFYRSAASRWSEVSPRGAKEADD